jgi:hypothetical protein
MGTGLKVALLAAAVVAALVLLVVLRPGGGEDNSADQVARAEITVTDGEVSGPERVEIEQGQEVALVVESDVADEVHVHGYDLLRRSRRASLHSSSFERRWRGASRWSWTSRSCLSQSS